MECPQMNPTIFSSFGLTRTSRLPRSHDLRKQVARPTILFLTMILFLSGGTLFAQKIVQIESPNLAMAEENPDAGQNPHIIFSNLGPTASDRYDSRTFTKLAVAGNSVPGGVPETWVAINFTPKKDVQAQVLLAAITYNSGTKLVNSGLYRDFRGEVGDPIPGAQGSTTDIPASGECCRLAKVTLPEPITLTAGKRYWLVGSPDNVNAPDFSGNWQVSNKGSAAVGPGQWVTASGAWPAAEVRGMPLINSSPSEAPPLGKASTNRTTIFSNLGPTPTSLFSQVATASIVGPNVSGGNETWIGLPFIPPKNSHAKTLAAAIQHVSGDIKVNLGVQRQ